MSNLLAGINFDQIVGTAFPGIDPLFIPGPATNIAGIITKILPYLFVAGGLILFVFLIIGGLQMMTGANDDKAIASARAKITSALTGFVLLFCSYWIFRLVLKILGLENL